jgi:hypothetical protein
MDLAPPDLARTLEVPAVRSDPAVVLAAASDLVDRVGADPVEAAAGIDARDRIGCTDAAGIRLGREVAIVRLSWVERRFQPAVNRTPARRNFCGSTASPSILVS